MSQTTTKTHRPFYDRDKLDQMKQIPILDLCNHFGIEFEKKGGTYWCKLRPERTASTQLYPDNNTFFDHGIKQKSDNIGLISTFFGVDRGEAIHMIADAYYISPDNPRKGLANDELTLWEYAKIGLDGGMATRNFDFDLEKQGFARVTELSLRYGMPMNVLKKNNPGIYEKLLKQRALPHVRDLRMDYYMEVFSKYNLAKAVGSEDVFYRAAENGEFKKMIEELQLSESILERACKGTKIDVWPVGKYDPAADLQKLLSGEVKLALGTASYYELKDLAAQQKTTVKYRTVDFSGFMNSIDTLSNFSHSAFIKDGNVVVGFLEKDYSKIKPFLDKIRIASKGDLNQKIAHAQQQSSCQPPGTGHNRAQAHHNSKGEER